MDRMDARILLERPELVLLHTEALRQQGKLDEALEKGAVAVQLARHSEAKGVELESRLCMCRMSLDGGNHAIAEQQLLEVVESNQLSHETRTLAFAYLTICAVYQGKRDEAVRYREELGELSRSGLSSFSLAYVTHASTSVVALLDGCWCDIVEPLMHLSQQPDAPETLKLMALNNASCALLNMGRVNAADRMADEIRRRSDLVGLPFLGACAWSTQAVVFAARGEYQQAEEIMDALREEDPQYAADGGEDIAFQSRWRRAMGDAMGAQEAAESAMASLGDAEGLAVWRTLYEIECAASRLMQGDTHAADTQASAVAQETKTLGARYHEVIAGFVLAEIQRRNGRSGQAVCRLSEYGEFIRTGSANLAAALYTRAFPGLLGLLAAAVGADRLPIHYLQLIGAESEREALESAWDALEPEEWAVLASRIWDEARVEELRKSLEGAPVCRVRLFGGLEVSTPRGVLPDSAWRKRKARLIFLMLVVKRGRDVAREQLLEHLWPEMDEQRARNNFYVAWNSLKKALSPEAGRGEQCPYVQHGGGLCRVSADIVRSDLDEFEEALEAAKEAEESGDTEAAVAAYERLEDVYAGDLLPGDIYDDWFAGLRDRYRQTFGDALLRASELVRGEGELDQAMHMLRRVLDVDPLREDVYRALLECQIEAGRRSAAVDTYMTCVDTLSEELGLDPSQETVSLYQQVLAMESSA